MAESRGISRVWFISVLFHVHRSFIRKLRANWPARLPWKYHVSRIPRHVPRLQFQTLASNVSSRWEEFATFREIALCCLSCSFCDESLLFRRCLILIIVIIGRDGSIRFETIIGALFTLVDIFLLRKRKQRWSRQNFLFILESETVDRVDDIQYIYIYWI